MPTWGATWAAFKRKAFAPKSLVGQLDTSASGSDMKRVLGATDLTFMGIGGIIGAGVFVLTGVAARDTAGPAVVLSYIIASVAATLSALCYTEFAVDMPVAGGAFVYINYVFGEFIGWVGASNLLLEYTLSAAAIARSFTSYAGALLRADANLLRVPLGAQTLFQLDIPALLIILVLSGVLAAGTQGGARFNTGVTLLNLAVIAFVFCAGIPRFQGSNFRPFLPLGIRGAFSGASKVFFSFIGFDTVATAAEETRDPAAALPIGITLSVVVCAVLYAAMCVVIVGMVAWRDIDRDAPFAVAFDSVGMAWAGKVVAAGALAGIVTSLLMNLFGQIRLWMTLGRERLVPERIARVSERTATPLAATAISALTAGAFAVAVDLEALSDLVSVGTLSVFLMVALASLWRRYVPHGEAPHARIVIKLSAMVVLSVAVSACFTAGGPPAATLSLGGAWLASVVLLFCERPVWIAARFRIPLHPLVTSLAVLANTFLISSLGVAAYVRFALWLAVALAAYLLYGLHHTHEDAPSAVELATMDDASSASGSLAIKAVPGGLGEPDAAAGGQPAGGGGGGAGKSGYRAVSVASPRSREGTPRQGGGEQSALQAAVELCEN